MHPIGRTLELVSRRISRVPTGSFVSRGDGLLRRVEAWAHALLDWAWHVLVLATMLGLVVWLFAGGHWIAAVAVAVIAVLWAVRVVRESSVDD
jgi:hypothetical protein